ncbi:MAG: acyltransferase family protein, partial [Alistipes sp.]|nr:acyltransferase family protein [Alistipes sp.]
TEFTAGSLRGLFSVSAGLLASRIFRPVNIKGAFWICSLAIVALLSVPRLGGAEHFWMNGLYETFCFTLFFPLILFMGASGKTKSIFTKRICKFLGDISYPLYIVHYPFIYWYYAWVKKGDLTFRQSLPWAVALVVGCIVLAYGSLKLYDEPVRRFLSAKFLGRQKRPRQ